MRSHQKVLKVEKTKIIFEYSKGFAKKKNHYLPKKALGDIIPVRLATAIAIPVSKNGTVKSTNA